MNKLEVNIGVLPIPSGLNWRWNFVDRLVKDNRWTSGIEIGVKEGRFSYFLLDNNPSLFMMAIDPWEIQLGNTDKLAETYESWDHDGYYSTFVNATKKFGERVKIHRDYSFNVAPQVEDKSFDFVFIDGLHTYDAVKQDIEDWYPKIKDTGMIIGHDFNWPTVRQAINDTVGLKHVFAGWNNCWGIWKKNIV